MKKTFTALALMLIVGLSSALAADEIDVDIKIKESFKKEFPEAELVIWNKLDDFYQASFVLEGHRVEAYFTENGELAGSSRTILIFQLPGAVIKSLKDRFHEAGFSDIHEIYNSEGTSYWLTAEIGNKKYRIKISPHGNISHVIRKQ
jgi:hypothetical protein